MPRLLGNIYADLSYGPLSGLAIGMDGAGTILDTQQNRVLSMVNEGLIQLYSKFLLHTREMKVKHIVGRTMYPLIKQHADTYPDDQDDTGEVFIMDSASNPYEGDLIKVLLAYKLDPNDSTKYLPVPLNDLEDDDSLFTPMEDVLQIPEPEDGLFTYLLYQARHYNLTSGDLAQYVYLPEVLYGALEAWISYRIFSGMNGEEHSKKAIEQYNRYQTICAEATDKDLVKQTIVITSKKLDERGYV